MVKFGNLENTTLLSNFSRELVAPQNHILYLMYPEYMKYFLVTSNIISQNIINKFWCKLIVFELIVSYGLSYGSEGKKESV